MIKTLRAFDLRGKNVLLRADFNVPMHKDQVANNFRIKAVLPTILTCIEAGAGVVIMSHMGRPQGEVDSKLSLIAVGEELASLLKMPIKFSDNCVSTDSIDTSISLKQGEVHLLENLRFHPGEQDNEMEFSNVSIDSNINFADSSWGWNETADVAGSRSHISLVRLEVPFQNDIRQTSNLTITTTGEWQYVSSPLNEWISGFSSNFTLVRAETSVSGYYTITLGPNEAPVVTIPEDYSLPWEDTSYDFLPIISDSPLSIHDCVWDIAGSSQNISVNLSQFAPDSSINVSVTCTDEGGLSDNYNTSLVLDDEAPWINASDEVQIIPPGDFIWDLMVGDDHDNNLRVYWTSNKSLDWWYTGDVLETSFYVDSNLNSANDNISQRHKARNNVEYWLSANVSDDVGHYTIGNWTIQLSDVAGPVVIADLEVLDDANEWNASRELFYSEESIRLNLTESFDDHSSIDKIKFSIRIYDLYFNDLSWSEAQYWELPKLGIGYHQLIIEAEDEKGNI